MKTLFFISLFLITISTFPQSVETNPVRFLALGDSYTIGEGVPEEDRWPKQFADALNLRGIKTSELTILARTGWRTDNLLDAVGSANPFGNYNLVALLIGVNNQFQGTDIKIYPVEFRKLLEIAIAKCNGRKEGVFVLSIPDYGYTPFGLSDQAIISGEINEYNQINRSIAISMGVAYYDITPISREVITKPEYLAPDNLHPSGEMYGKWVELIINSSDFSINTTGVIDGEQEDNTRIYPNPASRGITFKLPEDVSSLVIYNSQGAQIWQGLPDSEEEYKIDISGWTRGLYFYRLQQEDKTVVSGKFIKE